MKKHSLVLVIFLTVLWVILCESFSLKTIATGIVVRIFCIYLEHLLLPTLNTRPVSVLRLISYFFYLLGQIYISGFSTIKRIIFADTNVGIVEVKTKITSNNLKTILANSITLTPGTVSLDQKDDTITVLCLRHTENNAYDAGEAIKGKLERKLIKAQK